MLCCSLFHDFNLIISPNIITKQKENLYQTIRPIEVFQYENTRINFKFCATDKKKPIFPTRAQYTRDPKGIFF